MKKIDENVTADVMKSFDKYCKKYNVRYTAVKDTANANKPSYMIFYSGKNTAEILSVMQDAYKDYISAKSQKKASLEKGPQSEKTSVLAKLSFFRARVADFEKDRGNVEKNIHRDLISR